MKVTKAWAIEVHGKSLFSHRWTGNIPVYLKKSDAQRVNASLIGKLVRVEIREIKKKGRKCTSSKSV